MRLLLVGALVLTLSGSAAAQTFTNNPTTVTFTASADHHATAADGTPVLSSYDLIIYPAGGSHLTPTATISLGKPLPDATSLVRVVINFQIPALLNGVTYAAVVAAVGPGGGPDRAPPPEEVQKKRTPHGTTQHRIGRHEKRHPWRRGRGSSAIIPIGRRSCVRCGSGSCAPRG